MLPFPVDCVSPADRTEYAYRCQELLRLEHNRMGKLFREGKISSAEWVAFKAKQQPAIDMTIDAILEARASLKQSTKWNIDIEALIEWVGF